ncbi:hypothetical protein [Anaerosporobacter sp.]|uniref:hypothetical protein n=1 Tax=Anaerosporobacter sp. TaxID=1872529 RepID=UPI00286F865D|nr:hypothetical protein [Anaerosporobacter sp.]
MLMVNGKYDSIVEDFNIVGDFKCFLIENKPKILKYFEDEDCHNLRTLISIIGSIQKIYTEMVNNNFNTIENYERIMDEFLKYIVQLTIYYRNGGKVSDLKLTTEIGYVTLGQNIFCHTRGFKFLEKYCTTLSFSKIEFARAVSILRKEYEEEKQKNEKMKIGMAQAYGELAYWWELEDERVVELISLLRDEVKEDKYHFNAYQNIISQLMILDKYGFDVGSIDDLISTMNQNIDKSSDLVDIERFGYTFENDPILQDRYNTYVDRLKLKAGDKNQIIKSNEIAPYFDSSNWAIDLFKYCEGHYNEFFTRYGFIDLIDIDILETKINTATTKEIYTVRDIFKVVYRVANINEFFVNDIDKIVLFRDKVEQINFSGHNKPRAKCTLVEYLDDVIKRLRKEIYN